MTAFDLLFWIGEPLIFALMLRNWLVGRERQRVINEVARLGHEDLDKGIIPFWRWNEFYSVSHEKMLFSVRRVRSFYASHPCVGPPPVDAMRLPLP